ncbi:hypothetical protein Mgra_00008228 [Meloidogyne graminicola]|uniref:Uncharacterized protein n=1 Tax=Meloidogyne graminicola TaxID=189291 RepID=A0A8S9ZGK1_9BILA|nr:hypothetical protein Mgra_00008228 [Meloidogyne graminicola]
MVFLLISLFKISGKIEGNKTYYRYCSIVNIFILQRFLYVLEENILLLFFSHSMISSIFKICNRRWLRISVCANFFTWFKFSNKYFLNLPILSSIHLIND